MIHPSDTWRFVSSLREELYFEDDLVQHLLLEHRALRRTLTERVCEDAAALAAIRAQMDLAVTCNTPALPRLYMMEEVRGRTCYVMELVEGAAFTVELQDERHRHPEGWARMALRLLDMLLDLRRNGARFGFLKTDHLIVAEGGDLRINQRWIVGPLSPEDTSKSQILSRMALVNSGGVIVDRRQPEERVELKAVLDILTHLAVGSTRHNYEEMRSQSKYPDPMHPSPVEGVDPSIATLLVQVEKSFSGGPLSSLTSLRQGIDSFLTEALRKEADRKDRIKGPARATPPPAGMMGSPLNLAANFAPGPALMAPSPAHADSSDANPFAAPPIPTQSAPRSTPTPPPPTRTPAAPVAQPVAFTPRVIPQMGPVDELNPYGAPSASSAAPAAASATPSPPTPQPRMQPAVPTGPGIPWVKYGGIAAAAVLAIVVVIVAAPIALTAVSPKKQNALPTATIKTLAKSQITTIESVILDATASADPEGRNLTYTWEVVEPAGGKILFTPAETKRPMSTKNVVTTEPTIKVSSPDAGKFKISLRVSDGVGYSAPQFIEVESVVPLRRP